MTTDRYVVLGLAQARSPWFANVARWATTAALPLDFVKVVAVEEVQARLRSGRAFSALLVDAGAPGLDRDLVELAAGHGCPVVVIGDGHDTRPWADVGVAAALPAGLDRDQLFDALRSVARPIVRSHEPAPRPAAAALDRRWRGRLVAVTGAGGVGRSTLAMALASGLGADPRDRGMVVLADMAMHAQQALLHDAGDVVPGVSELVEGHRSGRMSPDDVRSLCFAVPERGYDLLLGLRRHRDWTALRPRALAASLDGLRHAYRSVVADVDPDVEGEAECGSVDVEERNQLARAVLGRADLAVVVGTPGPAGLHAQLRVVRDLVGLGIPADRVAPVVNRAPRSPRARAELTSALARLLAADVPGGRLACTPLFVPERRRLDEVMRDAAPPPAPLVTAMAEPVRALLDRLGTRVPDHPEGGDGPAAVEPGSLASWADDEAFE